MQPTAVGPGRLCVGVRDWYGSLTPTARWAGQCSIYSAIHQVLRSRVRRIVIFRYFVSCVMRHENGTTANGTTAVEQNVPSVFGKLWTGSFLSKASTFTPSR